MYMFVYWQEHFVILDQKEGPAHLKKIFCYGYSTTHTKNAISKKTEIQSINVL